VKFGSRSDPEKELIRRLAFYPHGPLFAFQSGRYLTRSAVFNLLRDPTLAAFIVCGPLQFLVSHLFSDRRSFQMRYPAFFKHGTGHAVECLNV